MNRCLDEQEGGQGDAQTNPEPRSTRNRVKGHGSADLGAGSGTGLLMANTGSTASTDSGENGILTHTHRAVQAVALSQNFAPAASKNATQEYLRQGCDTVILQHACVRHLVVVTKTK